MDKRENILIAILVMLLSAATVQAAVIHSESLLPVENIPGVNTYQTDGADMAGMAVTMFFTLAPAETVIWAATGVNSGAAAGVGGDWILSEAGDTFSSPWTLFYQGGKGLLTAIRIDGFAAGPGKVGVMFDRTFDGGFGTPDTFRGRDFEYAGPEPSFTTFVHYQNTIAVGAADPVGDEFRYLNVRFMTLPGFEDEFSTIPPQPGGLDGENLRTISFYQDTNNPIIPEPSVLILLTSGGLLFLRRKVR